MEEKNYKYLTLQSISEHLNIPVPSVKKIVGLLKNDRLLISKTGATGGILLTNSLEGITLFDVFKSVEGNKPMFKMPLNFDVAEFKHTNVAQSFWDNLNKTFNDSEQVMLESLKSKTLKDLI